MKMRGYDEREMRKREDKDMEDMDEGEEEEGVTARMRVNQGQGG